MWIKVARPDSLPRHSRQCTIQACIGTLASCEQPRCTSMHQITKLFLNEEGAWWPSLKRERTFAQSFPSEPPSPSCSVLAVIHHASVCWCPGEHIASLASVPLTSHWCSLVYREPQKDKTYGTSMHPVFAGSSPLFGLNLTGALLCQTLPSQCTLWDSSLQVMNPGASFVIQFHHLSPPAPFSLVHLVAQNSVENRVSYFVLFFSFHVYSKMCHIKLKSQMHSLFWHD